MFWLKCKHWINWNLTFHVQTLPQCLNDAVTHDKKIPMQTNKQKFQRTGRLSPKLFLFLFSVCSFLFWAFSIHLCVVCIQQSWITQVPILVFTLPTPVWFSFSRITQLHWTISVFYSFNNSSLNSHNFSFYVESYYVLNFWASTILLC